MPLFPARRIVIILPLAAALLAGCSQASNTQGAGTDDATPVASSTPDSAPSGSAIALSNATVQLPAVPGRPAVAYFTLSAGADATGTLTSVSVTHFGRAEMHESKMEGGAMTMNPVDSLPIKPGKFIVFAPAGLHVMLFDADSAIKAGDTTDLTATLANGAKITTKAKVTAQGNGSGGDAMAHMKM